MNEVEDSRKIFPQAGASVTAYGVDYRVWAPDQPEMQVQVERSGAIFPVQLYAEAHGYWAAFDPNGRAGDRYRFGLADGRLLPDMASRFQPAGVHGPSECIDPWHYDWHCRDWIRPSWTGQTIYELHIGTLTEAGTYRSAISILDRIRELGAEAIEIMPLADFAGDRNWGYDGVALYAPARCYGRPDDLRALVDAAHERGLAVILDVVYNHVGPAGNYLAEYSAAYFRPDKPTAWGPAFNLDGEHSRAVRDFLVANSVYWLDEFRFDGLRLDATHAIPDDSSRHLLSEIEEVVHARGAFLIAEDERNQAEILRSPEGKGLQFDALWADDFHHQVRVALTGIQDSYFSGYRGRADDLASTLAHGWTYRGQPFGPWCGRARGSACDHLPPSKFVICVENHDQVGNRPGGERLAHLVTPRQYRAASMLLCLSPYAPMIFMGQEWGASTPFVFFTDHRGELGSRISAGRRREFERVGANWGDTTLLDPESPDAFFRSKLRWAEREEAGHAVILALYRECLRERRKVLSGPVLDRTHWHLEQSKEIVAIRYRIDGEEWMLLAGLWTESFLSWPLEGNLLPPPGRRWRVVLHSEEKRFGGGAELPLAAGGWNSGGPAAVWLQLVGEGADHATD